ncbi:MAG: DUF5362 family protein [Bacteroidales bacterium]
MEQNQNAMYVSEKMKNDLLSMSKWLKFLAILGFIGVGFMIIAAIIMLISGVFIGSIMNTYNSYNAYENNFIGSSFFIIFSLVYLGLAVAYFFPILYLMNSAIKLGKAVKENLQESLESGIHNLKAHFKYMGIMIIVVFSLYIVFILGIVIFAGIKATQGIY